MYIAIEENIRIEFDRFYSAMTFNNIEMPEGLRDLLETLESNVIQEYEGQSVEIEEDAFEDGYGAGQDAGHDEGYHEGFEEGYEKGFQGGYEQCGIDSEDE
jgi:flagellar biosynthesis/type III secretory pathway protein FliH